MAAQAPSHDRLLTFRAGDQRLSLAIGEVREVTRMPRVTRVPHAPAAMLGLANLRGTVIPVFSAAALLDSGASTPNRLVVIDQGGSELLGLAVDEARQVASDSQAGAMRALDVTALAQRSMPNSASRRSAPIVTAPLRDLGSDEASTSLLVFAIGDQEFALGVGAVETVVPLPADIAVMPDSDAVVVGSAAIGGGLVPLLCLRALLALPDGAAVERPRVLVVRIGGDRVGLVVDALREICAVPDTLIDPVPQALRRGQAEARIQAICRLDHGTRLISVLATEHLLREDLTATMLARAEPEAVAMTDGDDAEPSEQFVIFRIAADEFAIPVGAVEEIAALPDRLTRLPRAPAFVQGVMNLRGTVVPVIDLAQRLGVPPSAGARRRVIVMRIGDLQAGFVVDAISDVRRIDAQAMRTAPDLGSEETRIFERLANLPDEQRIILVVSPRELLDRAEQDVLRALAEKGSKAGP